MSRQVTINKSFYDKLGKIDELAEEAVKDFTKSLAVTAIRVSPVDTGAFVESYKIAPRGAMTTRSRSSHGRPRGVPAEAKKSEELSRLISEIEAIDVLKTGGVVLSNYAPHANVVDDKYVIFATIRGKAKG